MVNTCKSIQQNKTKKLLCLGYQIPYNISPGSHFFLFFIVRKYRHFQTFVETEKRV